MSILTFGFYLIVAYLAYYMIVICYDVLTSKLSNTADGAHTVQYDFGHTHVPKVASLDDNENNHGGALRQTLNDREMRLSDDVSENREVETGVDLALENATSKKHYNGHNH